MIKSALRPFFFLFCLSALSAGCTTTVTGNPAPAPNLDKAAQSYYELGIAYLQKERYDLAAQKLQRSLHAKPTAKAYNALALLYETRHDNALASATYQRLLADFPDYQRGYLNYHIFLCQTKRDVQRQQLTDAMMQRGGELAALGQIADGDCALRRDEADKAQPYYRRALDINPDATGALLSLAEIDLNRGKIVEAKAKVDRVNEVAGYSARSVYLSLLVNQQLGNAVEAQKMNHLLRTRFAHSPQARTFFSQKQNGH